MEAKLFQLPILPATLMGWLVFIVLFALVLAAILHWKVSRHWSLLVLAIAPLCIFLGFVFFRIGEMPLRGATIEEIASGSRQAIQPLITAGMWIGLAGVILSGIGAIGSICRAVKLGRREKRERGEKRGERE